MNHLSYRVATNSGKQEEIENKNHCRGEIRKF
jgi:hypothetical protein